MTRDRDQTAGFRGATEPIDSLATRTSSGRGSRWIVSRDLLGRRLSSVVMLSLAALLAGLAESGILAIVAAAASALVSQADHVHHLSVGSVAVNPTVGALLIFALGLAMIRLATYAALSFLPAHIGGNVQAELRSDLFDAFSRSSWSVQSRDREGHLQEILTNQATQAAQGALGAALLISALLPFAILITTALVLNPVAALIVFVAAGVLSLALRPLYRLGVVKAKALSGAQMDYANAVGEAGRLAEDTQVFGVAAAQRRRVRQHTDQARALFIRTQTISRLVPAIFQSLIYIVAVLGLAVIYYSHAAQVAALGAVVLLLVRAGTYGQQVQASYQMARQAVPFVERLRQTQSDYEASSPRPGTIPLEHLSNLTFEKVTFAYRPGVDVLFDVSFTVNRGEAIGIIGPSGAGKSSIAQILLGLRDPSDGTYRVNGVPAGEIVREDWQKQFSYVPQEPRLIHASVADNIRYFRDIDEATMIEAARMAQIHDDIEEWADGYQTIIGPRADAVSGGQQQRICVARALAGRPEAIVLDEPTSALDPRSEHLIKEALAALRGHQTLFVVAHRPSMLDICDRVMVVVGGRIETFSDTRLLASHSAYHRAVADIPVGSS